MVRRGQFSYRNVARIFQQQTIDLTYSNYKESLLEYLTFSISHPDFLLLIETELGKRLPKIYNSQADDIVDTSLNLRTCNRLIDCLTTEDQVTPSRLFIRMLSQGNPLNVVVLLLKIALISPKSQMYLESRLANLITYYKQFMESECRGVIQFLEICSVTFAIYSNNVEYNLVQVAPRNQKPAKAPTEQTQTLLQSPKEIGEFRIFSRSFRAAQKRARVEMEKRKAQA